MLIFGSAYATTHREQDLAMPLEEGETYGIRTVSTTDNLLPANTFVGNGTNYQLDSDDTYGPIMTNSGALSGTDPWANFSR